MVLHLKPYIDTRKKLGLGFGYSKPIFAYSRNPQNLRSMCMGLGMKPTKSQFWVWVLEMVMRLIPKSQTQFFSCINVCLKLFKILSMTCVYSFWPNGTCFARNGMIHPSHPIMCETSSIRLKESNGEPLQMLIHINMS